MLKRDRSRSNLDLLELKQQESQQSFDIRKNPRTATGGELNASPIEMLLTSSGNDVSATDFGNQSARHSKLPTEKPNAALCLSINKLAIKEV